MSLSESKRKFSGVELNPGKTYRVITEFTDYDGLPHPVGETWTFINHNFLPYEDGLTLNILRDGKNSSIRLQWREDTQGHIVSNFSDFVEEV